MLHEQITYEYKKIGVRRLNLLSKQLTCESNLINQLFDIRKDLVDVAKQFDFLCDTI